MATEPIHPTKACSKCGLIKLATTDHFDNHGGCRFGVHSICQDCQHGEVGWSARKAETRLAVAEAERAGKKVCSTCRVAKAASFAFYFRDLRRGGFLPRCRDCLKRLRRTAYRRDIIEPRDAKKEKLPEGVKRCRACAEVRNLEDFFSSPECDRGVRPECKACTVNAQMGAVYAKRGYGCTIRKEPYRPGETKQCSLCKKSKPANLEYFRPAPKAIHGLGSWCLDCARAKSVRLSHRPDQKAKRRASKMNRNARIRGKSGFVSAKVIAELRSAQHGLCFYCKDKLNRFHVDHFIPIAKGGEHHKENLVIACQPCNSRKSAIMPWVWRPDLFVPFKSLGEQPFLLEMYWPV